MDLSFTAEDMQKPEKWAALEAAHADRMFPSFSKKSNKPAISLGLWDKFTENSDMFDITDEKIYNSVAHSYADREEVGGHLPPQAMLKAASDAVRLSEGTKNIQDTTSFDLWRRWDTEVQRAGSRVGIEYVPSLDSRKKQEAKEKIEEDKKKGISREGDEGASDQDLFIRSAEIQGGTEGA